MGNIWDRSGKMPGDRGGGWDWSRYGGGRGVGGRWIPKDPRSPFFGFGLQVEIRGAREAIRKLQQLGKKSRMATLRSIAAGAGVFRKAAKPASPVETGLLSRSWRALRVKTKDKHTVSYRVSPKPRFVGFVHGRGPRIKALSQAKVNKLRQRYGLSQDDMRQISGKQFARMFAGGPEAGLKKRYPLKYAHLVELGHDIVKGKRRGQFKGTRYMSGSGGQVVGHVAGRHFLKSMFLAQERNALNAVIARARKEFLTGGVR